MLEDAQAIFEAFASDPRVTKYMDWRPAQRLDLDKVAKRHAEFAADMAAGKRIAWVIRRLVDTRLCGKIELRIDGQEGDIGYVLAATHWGEGIMPEAMTAVLDFAQRLGLRRITGACDPDNRASVRVFQKCGFHYAGRQKGALIRPNISDTPRDSECYQLILGISIRLAREADYPSILSISNTTEWEKSNFLARMLSRDAVDVACDGERIVGFNAWNREFFSRPLIWLVVVDPEYRGLGIGSLLFAHAEQACKGTRLYSSTNRSNIAMQHFHERRGYHVCGELDLDPGDPEVFYCIDL